MRITSNISTVDVVSATGHPNIFLNQAEINNIKAKLAESGTNIWKTAWNELLNTDVAEAMAVTSYPNIYDTTGLHVFRDNNTIKTGDYSNAIKMARCVRALGISYALTGNTLYADKAINFIKSWCFDNATYMLPIISSDTNQIYLYITIPGMLYGTDLIWNYSNFQSIIVTYHKIDGTSQSLSLPNAIKAWTRDLATLLFFWDGKNCDTTSCQNYENWRVSFQMACASMNDDTTLITSMCNRYKYLIPYTIDTNGRMTHEITRTDGTLTCNGITYTGSSLSYSLYAINAMIQAAEIVRHHPELNQNLYTYKTNDNRGLEKALDFYLQYCADPAMPTKWRNDRYKQRGCPNSSNCSDTGQIGICSTGKCHTGNMGLWELANKYYNNKYSSVINTRGRPMYESRNMGPTTLTHGI